MIIECINCNKKFEVNSDLIPDTGRTIQCGSCNHTWFYKKKDISISETSKIEIYSKKNPESKKQKNLENFSIKSKKSPNNLNETLINKNDKNSALIKYQKKSNFTFGNFLSLIVVLMITFIAIIVIIDTFKSPLYNIFPKLELILISLYEVLRDIQLFVKDIF
tara:strand:- start:50 stop:538 length:489 start_codon:yes stop_codon:yes gene_type:complete